MFTPLGEHVWRNWATHGVPATGAHTPEKVEIRRWAAFMESLYAAAQAGGGLAFPTLAAAQAAQPADPYPPHQIAWVLQDSTVANNGIYGLQGPADAQFVKLGDLPYSYVFATDAGAGTPNAIQATSSVPVLANGGALVALSVFETNTGAPVTVAFNGGAALTVKTSAGNDVAGGGLVGGSIVVGFVTGTTFRLITDQSSAAVQEAIEAALAAAEAAAAAAAASAAAIDLPSSPAPLTLLRRKADGTGYEAATTDQVLNQTFTPSFAGATPTIIRKLMENIVSPFMFGGIGDGNPANAAVDRAALNACFARMRAQAAGDLDTHLRYRVDLSGGDWVTDQSINATGIVAWNWEITGGVITGMCPGKAILDLVGSRGYHMHDTGFFGHKVSRPSCAFQLARPTAAGFADNESFKEVSTTGWFSRAAIHCYAHETAIHDHCTYFNYDHTARVAIFEGYDASPFMSDHSTVMTGGTSFINNKVQTCDFRYLPVDENLAAITGITNAASGVVTSPGHSFAVGNEVVFAFVGGMPGLSTLIATVTAADANTFTVNVNTTALGTYSGGGIAVRRQTLPSVYLARAEQFNFDNSYIVAWGQPQLELGFPDAGFPRMEQLDLDLLFEGSGNIANVLFRPGALDVQVLGMRLRTYNTHAYGALIDIDTSGGGSVSIHGPTIQSVDPHLSIPLVADPASLALYGADILYGGISNVLWSSYAAFTGRISDINTGILYDVNPTISGPKLLARGLTGSGTAGGVATYITINIDGVDYKIALHAVS